MRYERNQAAEEHIIRRARAYRDSLHPRIEGIHVSDVIHCALKPYWRGQGFTEQDDLERDLMFLVGEGHHALIQSDRPEERIIVPGVVEVHGTIDTDAVLHPLGDAPGEIKTTRYSSNKTVLDLSDYTEQVAAYCLAKGTSHAQLQMLFLAGDYKKNRKPQLRVDDLYWEPAELAEWHQELKRRAAIHVQALAGIEPSAEEHKHDPNECTFCDFSVKRGGPCPAPRGTRTGWFKDTRSLALTL